MVSTGLMCALWVLVPTASLSLTLQVENLEVVAGEPFNLTLLVSSDGQQALSDVQMPDTGNLQILGTSRAESTNVNLTPGGASLKKTLRITQSVVAPQPGTYKIGVASVRSGQDRAQSEPLTLKAVASGAGAANPADDPAPGPMSGGIRATAQMLRQGLFATLEADRTDVTLGEQVTLTARIYARGDLSDISALRLPRLDAFWAEDLENPTRFSPAMVVVEGNRYQSYLLKRMAVFPTRAGTFELPGVDVTVVSGGSFFSAGRRQQLQSLPVTLVVHPLPAEGQPPGFAATNVGRFTLSAVLDRTRVATNQAVTLTVRVEGQGNIKQVTVPTLPPTGEFRAYDPTPSEHVEIKDDRLTGYKQLEYLLQPRKAGTFSLPTLVLHYFDPQDRRYHTVQGPLLRVSVTETADTHGPGAAPTGNLLHVQPRPLRLTFTAERTWPLWIGSPWESALAGGPLLFAVTSLLAGSFLRRRRTRLAQDRTAHARAAIRALEQAMATQAQADPVSRALQDYLTARLGPQAAGLTRPDLGHALQQRGVAAEDAQRLLRLLDQLDASRYAPLGVQSVGALAQEAVAVVRVLDASAGGP
jgi:hypothetical protein